MSKSETYIAHAKDLLTQIRASLSPSTHASLHRDIQTALSYIDASQIMSRSSRLEERIWFISELQHYCFYLADAGSDRQLTAWIEAEWNAILSISPSSIPALSGLGTVWLSKSQYYLSQLPPSPTDKEAEKLVHSPLYAQARETLHPAVDFLSAAVEEARVGGRGESGLWAKCAEAEMSLGNVCGVRQGREWFLRAVRTLSEAVERGERLPGHLRGWWEENRFVLL